MRRFLTIGCRTPLARSAFTATALLASAFLAHAQEARPLRGVAMVIGNSEYSHLPALANPANDARAVEMLLSALGFETELSSDRDARRLSRDLDIFIEDAEGADVAILYYAGHGIEAGGENFLVPVDADMSALDAAGQKMVPLSAYVEALQQSVPVVIVMLDACRDNPFPAGSTVRLDAGSEPVLIGEGGLGETRGATRLAPQAATPAENYGTVIAFAAEPGRAALDGEPGGNSPYTAAVLRHLETMAGEEFGLVMRMVAEEVYLKTAGRQRPWVNESLRRLLYFGAAPQPVSGIEGEILTERRQLLVTISALPTQGRTLVERVAGDQGVPMDALFAMLNTLGQDLPDDPADLDRLLRRLADDLKSVLQERSALKSTDPEIARLSQLAATATTEGALTTAVSLYEQAKARIGELDKTVSAAEDDIHARRVEFAEVYARSAGARALALDHRGAASDFAQAAAQVSRWDDALERSYRLAEARALIDHGVLRGDTPALEQAVEVLDALAREAGGKASAEIAIALGDALAELGQRQTTSAALERAVTTYRDLLNDAATNQPAAIMRKLGAALMALGRREIGRTTLEEAASVLEKALGLTPRDEAPQQWAATGVDLGRALVELAERDRESNALDRAIGHYEAALGEFDAGRTPASWASAQLGLGQALRLAGLRAAGSLPGQYFGFFASDANDATRAAKDIFSNAAEAYDAALKVCERETYPACWAAAQHGNAITLYLLGSIELEDREAAFGHFRRSMAAFENALSEQRFEMSPLGWAETYASRAEMLQRFAMRSAAGIALIYFAEAAKGYREALAAIDRESLPAMWLDINRRIADVYDEMIERDGRESRRIANAGHEVEHLRAALSMVDRDADREAWTAQMADLGKALLRLGGFSREREPFEEALEIREEIGVRDEPYQTLREGWLGRDLIKLAEEHDEPRFARAARAAYENAWDFQHRKRTRAGFEEIASRFADADNALAGFDTPALERTAAFYRAALAARPRAASPKRWARAQYDLAAVLKVLGERGDGTALLEEAATAIRAALKEWTIQAEPLRHGLAQEFLGGVLQRIAERGGGVPRYREEAAAYEAALAGLTLRSARYDNARINRKLADRLYLSIGQPEGDAEAMRRAIVHYRAAMETDTIEDSPGWFTGLQRAVGDVAIDLAYRGEGSAYATEAVEAYRLAGSLGEAMGTASWRAETEEKLALALTLEGELDENVDKLKQAVPHFEAALALRAGTDDALAEAYTRANIGRTLYLAGYRSHEEALLQRAASELKQAMETFDQAKASDSAVWASHYLGHALTEIAGSDSGRIAEAIAAYERVTAAYPRDTHASEWAPSAHNIAYLHMLAGRAGGGAERFEQALAITRQVLDIYARNEEAFLTALGNSLLCGNLTGLAHARTDAAMAREAVDACALAMPVLREQGDKRQREKAEELNRLALAALAELKQGETER